LDRQSNGMSDKFTLIIRLVLGLVFFAIVIVVTSTNAQCSKEKEVAKQLLNGKVIKVYLDSTHHNYETIEMTMNGKIEKNYFLLFEKSGVFNYLLPGDSISKNEGSLELKVFGKKEKILKNLHYGCVEG
jgi:hypothetical protein